MNYFEKFEQVANAEFDGHYTIMKFTGGYRVAFGTIETDDYFETRLHIENMPFGKTLEEACEMSLSTRYSYPGTMDKKTLENERIKHFGF